MAIYLDNAATTPMEPEVLEAMIPMMREHYGNPSSIHALGRKTRTAIENARKTIAKLINASPGEIFFTSGGTEADNMAIVKTIEEFDIKHAITSKIEHHAVLHTLEELEKSGAIKLSYVELDKDGMVDLNQLEQLLSSNDRTLVSLMHANNEIGNLLPLAQVGELCEKYNAILHSDTVQTMGHYVHDVKALKVHFLVGAGHKFHGPKGVGFIYISSDIKIHPLIHGGSQERNMRGGTENVYGIIGLVKALEIAYKDMHEHQHHVQSLKTYMIEELKKNIAGTEFNGTAEMPEKSLYTVLNVRFPQTPNAEMLLFNLDIAGICVSAGSACTSGSNQGSHVLRGIGSDMNRPSLRFSFSKYNTKEEIDIVIEKLKELFSTAAN
jgi:cysteine desulfurase